MRLKFSKPLPFSLFEKLVNTQLMVEYDNKHGIRRYEMHHNGKKYYVVCSYGDGKQNVNDIYMEGKILNTYLDGVFLERAGLLNEQGIFFFKEYHKQELEIIVKDIEKEIIEKELEIKKLKDKIDGIMQYLHVDRK